MVIPAYDREQADRLAEQVSEFCSCSVENFVATADADCTEILGEAVLQRRLIPLKDRTVLKREVTTI